jgi:hypothetical protein
MFVTAQEADGERVSVSTERDTMNERAALMPA